MKKIVGKIIIWSILVCFGIGIGITGSLTGFLTRWLWTLAIVVWIGTAAWIGLFFFFKYRTKRKTNVAFVGNQAIYQRIMRETEEAVDRYVNKVNRKGLFKGSAIYERPWFLLCGTGNSGKSSLLKGSGLNFPLRYPSEKDGLLVEGSNTVMWYFANEAVWIDTPGSFMEEKDKDSWQALIASIRQVRPITPADGVALVINMNEVLNTDDQGIKELAQRLRNRIDDLISQWGIEFPVYLLFNRTDEVPGFEAYFGNQLNRGQEQIFGATLSSRSQIAMPRLAFTEEFNLLAKSLTEIRLDKLFKEHDPGNKRMICRFVIHFEGIQQKLGSLVAELFKRSSYGGKPIFRGFYFTSCLKESSKETQPSNVSNAPDLSMTIVNHPLNPNRALKSKPATKSESKSKIRSLFVLPLFREIMVKDKSLVKTTQKRSRRELIRHYAIIGCMTIAAFLFGGYIVNSAQKSSVHLTYIKETISLLPPDNASLVQQYKAIFLLYPIMYTLQMVEDEGVPLDMRLGLYKGKPLLKKLKTLYFNRMYRFVVIPAVKYLEYDIRKGTSAYGDLGGDQYDDLYVSLKAYLSISEAVSDREDIDTVFLRPVLLNAIKQTIMAKIDDSRLPEKIESILQDNIGLYLYYLKKGEFIDFQEDQKLVHLARKRLRRLPSAQTLYRTVVSRLQSEVTMMDLDDLLNRQGEGILSSDRQVSVLYTQEGLAYITDAINDASQNPFKLDWVLGLTKNDVPESALDPKKMRDDMMQAYLDDFKTQWLLFLSSVKMEPFGDLQRSGRILQKLAGDQSELIVLLDKVGSFTVLKEDGLIGKAKNAAGKLGEKAKKNKMLQSVGSKFSFQSSSPFSTIDATFGPLRSFARSTDGALGGYEGFRDKLLTLAEKLHSIESQGEGAAVAIFNGTDNDPLLSGWNFSQKILTTMPDGLASSMKSVLLTPFTHTGTAVSKVLTKTINNRWQSEIVKPYTDRFSGKFPFSSKGEDASFNEVMDFFRPSTGTFWGFYDRNLSAYITKTSSGWSIKKAGSLELNFSPELISTIEHAERIRTIFFKSDGTLRVFQITISPSPSNKNPGEMNICGQKIELVPGGKSMQFNWPVETQTPNATLKILISKDFSQDISYQGQWGFMKLLQAARVNKVNRNSISAKWKVNVQNMYVVYFDSRIQIPSADHPFAEAVFQEFNCPTQIIDEQPSLVTEY